MRILLSSTLFIVLTISLPARAAADSVKGKAIYAQRCAACHSIEFNGTGPMHRNLLGRKAGAVADYAYSTALKSSKIIWSNKTLDKWLIGPEKLIPGQKMWINVPVAQDRQDIIAYLKTESSKP